MGRTATKSQKRANRKSSTVDLPESISPSLELERASAACKVSRGVENRCAGSINFAWLGSGQCGGRLVKTFYDLGYHKAMALNTTQRDLDHLSVPKKHKFLMDIGSEGAGKDMNRGREAASLYNQQILHEIEQIFGGDVDHIMVCFGAGGGTGSGSATGLIEIAQQYARYIGLRNPCRSVGALMTLPTNGEAGSPRVAENAYTIASELAVLAWQNKISPLLIVDNDKISKLHPNLTVKQFWPTINRTVGELFDIFNRLTYLPSEYTAFDPTDYYSIISAGGCTIMGVTCVRDFKNKFAISRAIKENLQDTLLTSDFDLSRAKVAGSIIVGGKKMMGTIPGLQDAINYGFDVLADITGQATVHRGIYEDKREALRVYTIIGGLPAPSARLEQLRS
ncbi:MAG: hypothetical protein JXA82_12480 [Sedimentisphaerales bacterium]|nr:hypothetical protein [Sedimentisphaerales bacterium]